MGFYQNSATAASNTTVNGIGSAGSSNANLIDDLVRELAAQGRQFANDLGASNTVGGTADAITITPSSGSLSAAHDGLLIGFLAGSTNTSTSVTANVGGLGSEPVKKGILGAETTLAIGDIRSGGMYLLRWRSAWDSAGGAWELIPLGWGAAAATDAGQIGYFARNSAPAGWLKADGTAVSRTTYAALFAAISTTFGTGDGSTTFNLPDLRGEFVRGWDDSRGVDSGRSFGSAQAHMLQEHTHTVDSYVSGATGTSGRPQEGTSGNTDSFSTLSSGTTGTFGSETRPRNIALLACIRY